MFDIKDSFSFGNIPQPSEKEARAAIIPVPLEVTVCYGRGVSLGPAAVIAASANMEFYDEFLNIEPINLGIITRSEIDVSGDIEQVLDLIESAVEVELLARRLPVLLGGEHSVTIGALRALVKHFGNNFTVLTLDAHLDLRDSYNGSPYSHSCVMKRALDLGLGVQHLGVRSCSVKEVQLLYKRGLNPVWAYEVYNNPRWLNNILERVKGPVYISLDVDGLDPAYMPATGTPEPGGLTYIQVTDWLKEVCNQHHVLGLDIVELAPIPGQVAWDFTVARLLYRALGLVLVSSYL